ncbi:MAG: putative lipoprotein [bacterium]|nr:putative lipoprotein [bacterium]
MLFSSYRKNLWPPALAILTLTALWMTPGCAVFTSLSNASDSVSNALGGASTSLESISTSVTSISGSLASSSASSGDDEEDAENEKDEAFRRDVRNYTAAFARQSGGSATDYQRELGRIARTHGLVNWRTQSASQTFQAIGAGLQAAGLDRDAVIQRFQDVAPTTRERILIGFDRESRL